jgi:hypothetical protein
VPEELADTYEARVKLNAGPFAIDDSKPTVLRKSQLAPVEKVKKADGK